jgi:hypothetical protein
MLLWRAWICRCSVWRAILACLDFTALLRYGVLFQRAWRCWGSGRRAGLACLVLVACSGWRAVLACLESLGLRVACLSSVPRAFSSAQDLACFALQRAWSHRISGWRAIIACLACVATQVWLATLACLDSNVFYSGLACSEACLALTGLLRYGVLI